MVRYTNLCYLWLDLSHPVTVQLLLLSQIALLALAVQKHQFVI
jgi:hypothetical protein